MQYVRSATDLAQFRGRELSLSEEEVGDLSPLFALSDLEHLDVSTRATALPDRFDAFKSLKVLRLRVDIDSKTRPQ